MEDRGAHLLPVFQGGRMTVLLLTGPRVSKSSSKSWPVPERREVWAQASRGLLLRIPDHTERVP